MNEKHQNSFKRNSHVMSKQGDYDGHGLIPLNYERSVLLHYGQEVKLSPDGICMPSAKTKRQFTSQQVAENWN